MKTISKSKARDPNENNITTSQTTSTLRNIRKDNTRGNRSVLLHVEINPTAAVIRKPLREENENGEDEDEGPRPYPPNRPMSSGLRLSISGSGSSHSRMSSNRGGEDGDEMSDREKNEGVSDGDEFGSAYPLPVTPQRNGSIVGSVEHNITPMAGQEEGRSLTQVLSIRFLKTIQVPFLFLYGLFRLAVLESIIYILLFWVIMLEIQTIWPHGCLTFPSVPTLTQKTV